MNEAGQDDPRTDVGSKDKAVPEVMAERWQKIKELFVAASERNPKDRNEFLNQACGSDKSLRAEVESLLVAAESEAPASALLNTSVMRPLAAQLMPDLMVGRRAGAYQLVRRIGTGGMAAVYLAVRADDQYQKQVAVKVVRPQSASEELLNRFRNERQTLASLDHPNIVKLLDGGNTDEGLPFLVMDYVEGTPIDDYCDARKLSIEERLRLFCQVCAAVQYAHQHQIIHRDLKPSNILVTPNGAPKLLDFGIAKVFDPRAPAQTLVVTQTSTRRMTPAYASPEQVRGEVVTSATDIYSLGVVLYELLTGHRPYKLKQSTPAEIERAICEEEPEKLSTAVDRVETVTGADGTTSTTITPEVVSQTREGEPDKLRRRLRGDLDNIVLMALQKEPQRRYASVEELANDLQKHLDHLPVLARPNTLSYRASKFISRHKTEAVAAALLLLVLGGGVFFTFWEAHRAAEKARAEIDSQRSRGRRSIAVLGFRNASGRNDIAWVSKALSEMLTTELTAGEKLRTISSEEVAQAKINLQIPEADSLGRASLGRVYKNLGSDFVVLGSYLDLGGADRRVRLDLRLQDAALGETVAAIAEEGDENALPDLVIRAGEDLRDRLGVSRISAAESAKVEASLPQNPEAIRLYAEGVAKLQSFDFLGARDLLEKAAIADPTNALIHLALVEVWVALGYEAKAKDEAKKAFDLAGDLPREQNLWIEGTYRQIARENDKAIEIYRTLFTFFPDNLRYGWRLASAQKGKDAVATIEALRKLPPPARDDPLIDVAEADNAGRLGEPQKQAEAAGRAARKAEARGARLLAGRARITEANALEQLGQLDKALAELKAAKQLLAELGDRYGEARALRHMSTVLADQAKFEEAKQALQGAIEIVRQVGNRAVEAQLLNNLANIQAHQNDDSGAIASLNQSLAISRELGYRHAIAVTLDSIATRETDHRQLKSAEAHFQESLDIYRDLGDQAGIATSLGHFAEALEAEGKIVEAKSMLEESVQIHRRTGIKTELGMALINLASLQANRGELAPAKRSYSEALQILDQSKSQMYLGYAIAGLGELALTEGDFDSARKHLDEALAQRQQVGTKQYIAESWLSQANLALEEGNASNASHLAQQAAAVFSDNKSVDLELQADALTVQSLLAEGKLAEAAGLIATTSERAAALEDFSTQTIVRIANARVRAASGKATEAQKLLEQSLADTRKAGLLALQFETRLALGEAEIKAGNSAAGRAELRALERDARAKGFVLMARKAAITAKQHQT